MVSGKPPKQSKGSYVNIGLLNDCLVDKILTPGLRVTVKLEPNQDLKSRKIRGKIVSPVQPRLETGVYWGYTVRIAKSFSDIFTNSAYENGYDLSVGTSDKGRSLQTIESKSLKFKHALIVYGGVMGLEAALENDDQLDADDPSLLFDEYLNVAPNQGTIQNARVFWVGVKVFYCNQFKKIPIFSFYRVLKIQVHAPYELRKLF